MEAEPNPEQTSAAEERGESCAVSLTWDTQLVLVSRSHCVCARCTALLSAALDAPPVPHQGHVSMSRGWSPCSRVDSMAAWQEAALSFYCWADQKRSHGWLEKTNSLLLSSQLIEIG